MYHQNLVLIKIQSNTDVLQEREDFFYYYFHFKMLF